MAGEADIVIKLEKNRITRYSTLMTFSNSDKSLVTSLATALHACVTIHKKEGLRSLHGHPFRWRVYSDICATLWKLNLAKIKIGNSEYCMDSRKYVEAPDMMQVASKISVNGIDEAELVPINDIASKISFVNWGEHLNLTTLIEQFVFCMSQLGVTETLPVSRKSSFKIQDGTLTSAMNELVDHGFAVKQGSAYQWTDKISVHMISNYLWAQDEVINAKVDPEFIANSLEKLKSQALNKIPSFSRGKISTCTSLGMSIALLEHWDGNSWHGDALSSPAISFENAMGIAKNFLNLYSLSGDRPKWSLKQHRTLSKDDKKLVFSLAKMFYNTWERSMFQQDEELVRGYFHRGFNNAFKSSAYDLWVLGLATAAWPAKSLYDITYERYKSYYENPQNLGFLPYIKLVPKSEINERIQYNDFYPNLSIFDIVCTFLELASEFGGGLSIDRHSRFKAPNSDLEPALKALTEYGYLKKMEFEYMWTDKISVHMIANYYWEEEDFDPSNIDPDLINGTFLQIEDIGLGQIPREAYDGYIGRRTGDVMGLTFYILRHWSATTWSKKPLPTPSMSMDNTIAIARKILKKYKHSDDYKNHCWLQV